jgi:CRISPR system Cascade subunit CasB
MNKLDEPHPFVTYLESLAEDRAALAALRRGLGQPPGTVADTFRYVVPRLPANPSRRLEESYYLVAALYASHPTMAKRGNLGHHFSATFKPDQQGSSQAIERRFTNLLAAHPDDLAFQLRQAVSFLRSQEQPINWHRLLRDILYWNHPARFVQKNWANAFWGRLEIAEGQEKKAARPS